MSAVLPQASELPRPHGVALWFHAWSQMGTRHVAAWLLASALMSVVDSTALIDKFDKPGASLLLAFGYTAAVVGLPGGVVRVSGTSKPDRLGVTMYDATAGVRWLFDGATVPSLADARASAATVDSKGRVVVVGAREVGGTTRLFLIRLWT